MNTNLRTPKLSFYHPNAKLPGSAIQFELRPAHGFCDGAIFCRIAVQKTIGDTHNAIPHAFPTFDWDNAIIAKFGFEDICKMLQVFRGECESIDDGKGLYHQSTTKSTQITLTHMIDPVPGYSLYFAQTNRETGAVHMAKILFTTAEALGLCEVLAGSLKEIAFGTSFEATSIAIARDEAMEKAAADLAAEETRKAKEAADKDSLDKAIAKVNAVGTLCAVYGKEYADRIQKAVDRACGDTFGDNARITDEERQLGLNALGADHPIWKYVK